MQAKLTNRPIEQVVAAIRALDLEPIRQRVMDEELGEGWSREHAESVERGYRNYLTMLVKHPEDLEDIVVSKDVDEFWHTHILHTMKYTQDCERVFGHYLHHNPHVGKRTQADIQRKAAQVEKTRRLYEQEQLQGIHFRGVSAVKDTGYYSGAVEGRLAYCAAASSSEAYCAAAPGKEAAYCAAASGKEAAYCAAASGKEAAYCAASGKEAAYCAAASGKEAAYCAASGKEVAYCAATSGKEAAYCAAASGKEAAYCAASGKEVAYCAATSGKEVAYCAATSGKEAAYCAAALRQAAHWSRPEVTQPLCV
jgi:hypothetical protein